MRSVAVSANGQPASDASSIGTYRSCGVIRSPGDTLLLLVEKRMNIESEPL
ncbi:hypothetical protein APTSU1_000490700 [Apodemus speciosus]|uniref:Uncharacterized protein n=1 Tax=Apodemus speciosus TaxID=105296 RepID=A0ABQ0ERN2_APOSI